MRLVIVVALVACNQVFGVHPTGQAPPIDAQQFDARDQFACPPPGIGTAPVFSNLFSQVVADGACLGYSTSARAQGLATGNCSATADLSREYIAQGAIDAPLGEITLVSNLAAGGQDRLAKLSPEGDQLWLTQIDPNTVPAAESITVFVPSSPNTWTWSFDAYKVAVADSGAVVGTPMRVGVGRRVLYLSLTSGAIRELVEGTPGTWTIFATYSAPQLGIADVQSAPNLSPDGLRIVFAGISGGLARAPGVFYADRDDISKRFGTAIELVGPPQAAETPFLAEDCSRLYFSGLGSVLYVPETQ